MSYAFAQRHSILAVAVDASAVTIASSQPFVHGWEANLTHVLKRPIKRVVANPADIQRFTVEFYRLAKSVSGASGSEQKISGVGNFEQLLNLGASDGTGRQRLAHRQHRRLAVPVRLPAARQRHPHRAAPRSGHGAFSDRRCAAQRLPVPAAGGDGRGQPAQDAGADERRGKRKPQDGRVKTKTPDGGEVELRLSTCRPPSARRW